MCHRGLDLSGRTPCLHLRHAVTLEHPGAFTGLSIEGGADRRQSAHRMPLAEVVGRLPSPAEQGCAAYGTGMR
jgi:hypothetical protein